MEMYVASSTRMGVEVLVGAMGGESGWRLGVEILSFYLEADGAYGIPGLAVGRIRPVVVPRNCQPWDILST